MSVRPRLKIAVLAFAFGCAGALAQDAASLKPPAPLERVRFEQRVGESVPLDLAFRSHDGSISTLGNLLGERPVILALVYYECPMLCPMIMNGLVKSLRSISLSPGDEFDIITLSFDPEETPSQAAAARATHMDRYGSPTTDDGWYFLTGSEESIARLTDAVGFSYVYDEETDEWAHAAGLVVLTPEGKIARYFYGIEYPPRDLRLGLVEAGAGRIGSLVDQVLLYCYEYDPATGTYSAVVMNIVRVGGVVTLLALALFLIAAWRLDRRLASMEKTV